MLLTIFIVLGGLVACSADSETDSSPASGSGISEEGQEGSGPGSSSAEGLEDPAVPEPFEGDVDAFYRLPDPLPDGEPGDLIRIQPMEASGGETAMRVMYLSEDRTGQPRAVTGTIFHPDGDAPEGGWPIIADAHGTTGIVEECAPSRMGLVPSDHGVEAVRVMSDYIGLGPEGERHPYLSKTAEANAVLDGLVAARALLGDRLSDRWLVVGHSQGGHAALSSIELAGERVPDLELVGAVVSAPGAQFLEVHDDELQLRIITSMILLGSESEWPDLRAEDFFAPDTLETVEGIVGGHCLDEIVPAMIPLAADSDLYTQDPLTSEATREFMEANDPLPEPVGVPMLLLAGGRDIIVVPARVEALRERLCGIGQQLEYRFLPDADHGTLPVLAADEIDAWVGGRLAGEPAGDDCENAPR